MGGTEPWKGPGGYLASLHGADLKLRIAAPALARNSLCNGPSGERFTSGFDCPTRATC
jgi:hypothetical protein